MSSYARRDHGETNITLLTSPIDKPASSKAKAKASVAKEGNGAAETDTTVPSSKADDAPAVSLQDLISICGSEDPELLGELLRLFIELFPDMLSEIQSAVTSGDKPALRDKAHAAKGASGNAGAVELFERLKQLERDAGALDDEALLISVEQIKSAFDRVRVFVENSNFTV